MSTPNETSPSASFNGAAEKIISLAEFRAAAKEANRKEIGVLHRIWDGALRIISAPILIPVNIVHAIKTSVRDAKAGKKKENMEVFLSPEYAAKIEKNPLTAVGILKRAYMTEAGIRNTMNEREPSKPERLLNKFSGLVKKRQAIVDSVLRDLPDHSAEVAAGKLVPLKF